MTEYSYAPPYFLASLQKCLPMGTVMTNRKIRNHSASSMEKHLEDYTWNCNLLCFWYVGHWRLTLRWQSSQKKKKIQVVLITESSHDLFIPWTVIRNTPEFVGGSDDTESACKGGDPDSVLGSGDRSVGCEGFTFLSW